MPIYEDEYGELILTDGPLDPLSIPELPSFTNALGKPYTTRQLLGKLWTHAEGLRDHHHGAVGRAGELYAAAFAELARRWDDGEE